MRIGGGNSVFIVTVNVQRVRNRKNRILHYYIRDDTMGIISDLQRRMLLHTRLCKNRVNLLPINTRTYTE